ncbi:MAG: acetyl-CoA carboxylase carboxyltransferase subunit alpha [Gaiellaceae bacterium]
MTSELELRLRERIGKLMSLRLPGGSVKDELRRLQVQLDHVRAEPSEEETWKSIELARHDGRPYTLDYLERLIEDWVELHGDRAQMDDAALVTGLGRFRGRTVAIIGHQKGRDARERQFRNFGMASPEGYRKGMRVMEIADRHGFPLLTFVDTPGAYPGVAAEQHGQGGAIAASQSVMARLRVPTITSLIGEGNSGGAIAIGLADRVLMQQNAYYTVISPEGFSAIIWRTQDEKKKAAAALRPDAQHCLELGVIDTIVPEPEDGAHTDYDLSALLLGEAIELALKELEGLDPAELKRRRRARYRAIGVVAEAPAAGA